jgi:hypothetical protein
MAIGEQKQNKKATPNKRLSKRNIKTGMSRKRKNAIEKALTFWKAHAIDLTRFTFNREEANAR